MPSKILIVKNTDPRGLLKNSIGLLDGKSEYLELPIKKVKGFWNTNARRNNLVIVSDYLIEHQTDADTVLRFIKSFENEPGSKFYAPRPNSYLPVSKPSIYGTSTKVFYRKPIVAIIKDSLKRLAKRLPTPMKRKIKHGIMRVMDLKLKRNEGQSFSNQTLEPELVLPTALCNVNASWVDWRDPQSLERDLTYRNHLYFPHPTGIHVAVSNECNLKCVMCPYHSPVYKSVHSSGFFDEKKSLQMETFKRTAAYAGKRGITLQFGQIEETLLHPHIFDFIKIAKESGVPSVHLTTNGTILNKRRAKLLADSGVDSVMFSVDSTDPSTYKKIRGAKLEKLEKNIEYFLTLAKPKGIHVECSFIRQKPAMGQQEEFIKKWKEKGVNAVVFYVLTDFDLKTGEFIRTETFREDIDRYACASPWQQSVIMPDGSVGLCCKTMTDVGWKITSVGNVNLQDFDEIWNSDRYKKVRSELIKNDFKDFSTCNTCQIWSAATSITEQKKGYTKVYNETMERLNFH